MPSGSWASWIAPRPDRIGTKYVDVMSALTLSPWAGDQSAIHVNTAVPAGEREARRAARRPGGGSRT